MAKLAIIIPAYNAGMTLERAVKSVLAQTLRDIDVWIVDDGSTDDTPLVCDRLAEADTRVHVIHQQNSGCYQARLNALQKIQSDYFGFVDADDVVNAAMYEVMLSFAESEKLDVVQCKYSGEQGVDGAWRILEDRESVLKNYVEPVIVNGNGSAFVWNKIYRNEYDFSIFDKTDHVTMSEDMIFNLQFFENVKRMGFIDKVLYQYNVNAGSSVRNFRIKNLKDFAETLRMRKIWLPKYGFSYDSAVNGRWIRRNMLNTLISACAAPSTCWAERVEKVQAVLSFPGFPFLMLKCMPAWMIALTIFTLKKCQMIMRNCRMSR